MNDQPNMPHMIDARTEIGFVLYQLAVGGRSRVLKCSDITKIRRLCEDALPDDDSLLNAVDHFADDVFRAPERAASDLLDFVFIWWGQNFPESLLPTSSKFADWHNRLLAGGDRS